jgi:hypothetical protein
MNWVEDHILWIIVGALVATLLLGVWAAERDQNQWDEYARSRHCVSVGVKKGQLSTGVSPDGKGVVTSVTPDQTVYRCDGGEIEIR